jgi:DNA (cytosine-5)-methyltransferase 1
MSEELTLGSLFDGISGFPLAANWAGIETKWICEKEEYCLRVSKNRFKDAEQYGDIKEVGTGRKWEPGYVDILAGGDPCQPSSLLGKRLGEEDPRFLWPEKFRLVKEIKPSWVVNENVIGTISNGFLDKKISDLESENYTCWPALVIPASSTGADHHRYRVWLVAYSNSSRRRRGRQETGNPKERTQKIEFTGCGTGTFWESGSICSPELCGMAHGIPNWMDRNHAGGNAIDPRVAFEIFNEIKRIESIC